MKDFCTLKKVIKEHEINLSPKTHDQIKEIMILVAKFPTVLHDIESLISFPAKLDDYLNHLLDSGRIIRYELAKELILIFL